MKRKHVGSLIFLLLLIFLTVYAVVKGNDMNAVIRAIKTIDRGWLMLCAAAAILFVSGEGCIIWYLFGSLGIRTRILQCVKWSFIGFFFSGITPSSTGGQPAQLYFMKKEGIRISDSTPVLMITAVLYKFVIVMIGALIGIFWGKQLSSYFGSYMWLFYLGFILNAALVVILVFIMVSPALSEKIVLGVEKLLVKFHILKQSSGRKERLKNSIDQYQDVVNFFRTNKSKIFVATAMTLMQRVCAFCLTWFIYRGLGLNEAEPATVIVLQAAIYIAVDMMPLPGATGITELVYFAVFARIFTQELLTASMCVSRGISFYLVLLLSAVVYIVTYFRRARVAEQA